MYICMPVVVAVKLENCGAEETFDLSALSHVIFLLIFFSTFSLEKLSVGADIKMCTN